MPSNMYIFSVMSRIDLSKTGESSDIAGSFTFLCVFSWCRSIDILYCFGFRQLRNMLSSQHFEVFWLAPCQKISPLRQRAS